MAMGDKHALCVGLNYPGTGADLGGCVNDAYDWANLLAEQGYEVEVIIEATKAQIVAGLIDLVNYTGFGDKAVFTYSGHGTWLPDQSGDEIDARDEALVPADYWDGYILTDDELDQIFSNRRYGAGFLMLSDSCHSGSVTRFSVGTGRGKPRYLPPSKLNRGISQVYDQHPSAKATLSLSSSVSLISGCTDQEYSYDASFDGRGNGAFTRAAIDSYEPGMSLNSWFKAIRQVLPQDWYPQTPQLTASSYRKYARAL
jgi:hypothetical protein